MTNLSDILQRPDLPASASWPPEEIDDAGQMIGAPQMSLSRLLTAGGMGGTIPVHKVVAAWLAEQEKLRLAKVAAASPKSTPGGPEAPPRARGGY
jgi:hypothetical protein